MVRLWRRRSTGFCVSQPHDAVPHVQVGYKSMMYMVLHAEAVLDLVAVRDREIQFRQVAGSFVTLQGKFLLHADPEVGASPPAPHPTV